MRSELFTLLRIYSTLNRQRRERERERERTSELQPKKERERERERDEGGNVGATWHDTRDKCSVGRFLESSYQI